MQQQGSTVEQKLARIAERQHGVVTRAQLLAAGITPEEIRQRTRRGALLREFRSVYRVGHRAPSVEARYLAAVLACGEGALLCGRAAAHLLGVIRGKPPPPEVTAPTQRRIKGVRTKRSRVVRGTTWKGIPVVTVANVLVDLAAVLSFDDLGRACHEAGIKHGTTPGQVEEALVGRPRAPGVTKLRRVTRGEAHVALSKLEKRFLGRLREADLPLPHTNRPAGSKRVDCRWPEHRLTVELDSYTFHNSHYAWEQDHRREREAHARKDQFRRYTWDDVTDHPHQMLTELRALLC